MKKIIYSILILSTVVVGLNACKKDVVPVSDSEFSKPQLDLELKQLFTSVKTENSQKSLIDSLANPNNPYNNAGVSHNQILKFIESNVSDTITLCSMVDMVKYKFNVSLNCSGLIEVSQHKFHELIDTVSNEYSSELFAKIYASGGITLQEYKIIHTTFDEIVNNTSDINSAISKLKVAENYVVNIATIESSAKKRILSSFAILKYSLYYWLYETDAPSLCEGCSTIDAAAEYFAMNCTDCSSIQDGASIYAFASMMSAIAAALF